MSKHEIEVEGLPEGYVPVAFRMPLKTEKYFYDGEIYTASENMAYEYLIVKKKQPRRIVLEETEEVRTASTREYCQCVGCDGVFMWDEEKPSMSEYKIWREVKETEEPKLCLSVEECMSIERFLLVSSEGVTKKIMEFIKNNKTS